MAATHMTASQEAKLDQIGTDVAVLKAGVAGLEKVLADNGQPGLVTKVQEVLAAQKACPARVAHTLGSAMLRRETYSNWIALLALLVVLASTAWQVATNRLTRQAVNDSAKQAEQARDTKGKN